MKKIATLSLFFLFLAGSIIAQNSLSAHPEGEDKGPVIDNISADVKLNSGVDSKSESGNAYNNIGLDDDGSINDNNTNDPNEQNYSDNKLFDESGMTLDGDELIKQIKANMKIYPVPVIKDLTIDLGTEVQARIRLVNIIGQEIFSIESSKQIWRFDLSDYPAGTYFLSIEIGKDLIVKRIEKHN